MVTMMIVGPHEILRFDYTNYRMEHSCRTVMAISVWQGSTEWHPEEQWFLRAKDITGNASDGKIRDFAMRDIKNVKGMSDRWDNLHQFAHLRS